MNCDQDSFDVIRSGGAEYTPDEDNNISANV